MSAVQEGPVHSATRVKEEQESVWVQLEDISATSNPLDLSLGCPNFLANELIRKDLKDVTASTLYHQYTRGFGHPRLVSSLSSLYSPLMGRTIDPTSEVVVTHGAMEALFISFMGLLNTGDEVILMEPFFDSYLPQIEIAGGTAVFVPLEVSTVEGSSEPSWVLNKKKLAAAFSSKTKLLVLNTPHNPTGKVFSREDLDTIADLCNRFNVICISDEVYEWITFDKEHIKIASLPGMWDRTITLGSAGKTFSITGWKIGWAIGSANLLAGPKVVHQNSGYIGITPTQEALARTFERETLLLRENSPNCFFTQLQQQCMSKRNKIVRAFTESGLKPIVPEGTYYILVDIREMCKKLNFHESTDSDSPKDLMFVKWLAKEKKLMGIPPSIFYSKEHKSFAENLVRFCFLKDEETLESAAEVLRNLSK